MKFSIFGSNGFIGSNIVNFLRSQKIECDTLELNDEKIFERQLGHVIYCIGITADFRERPFDTVESHVLILHKILKKCKFDSFLYLSSTRVYSDSTSTNETDQLLVDPNNLDNLYNISKIMGEAICNMSKKQNVRVVRLSNVVGKNFDSSIFLSSIIQDAIKIKKIILETSLDSERDYVCIDDVVDILQKISLHGKSSVYNIANGQNLSNEKIVKKLQEITGCEFKVVENAKKYSFLPISIKRIQREFNFEPTSVLNKFEKIICAFQNKI